MAFNSETAANAGKLSSRKGKPNFLTKESREIVSLIAQNNFEKFETELKKLEGKDYCMVYLRLMEYHLPKLNRTEITDNTTAPIIINFKD